MEYIFFYDLAFLEMPLLWLSHSLFFYLDSIILIRLITLAYSQATLCGEIMKNKGMTKYVGRVTEKGRKY